MAQVHLPNLKTRESLRGYLNGLALEIGVPLTKRHFAEELDRRDELAHFRDLFHVPIISELLDEDEIAGGVDSQEKCVYLNGCSLGLQPKGTQKLVDDELEKWRKRGIRGHYMGEHPWYPIEDEVVAESAKLVGAECQEVTVMNSLTVNIHLGLASFYKPTKERFKILMESEPFPSDKYAVESQILWHGLDPSKTIIYAHPREGETIWRTEDIIKKIEEEGDSIALVYFSGVHYTSGHLFDIRSITMAAHSKGCYAGFDLAHAAGNVELHLHEWEVDFACWCTYKYINSGPGSIAGFFVHKKQWDRPRLAGWWSHDRNSRLSMPGVLQLQPGAAGFQLSNPPVLQMMCLLGSLNVFKMTSMTQLTKKSRILTTYLELLLEDINETFATNFMRIVTSSDPAERGCQLSLHFEHSAGDIQKFLRNHGVVTDTRGANGLRVCPVPLYNTFVDVLRFRDALEHSMAHMLKEKNKL